MMELLAPIKALVDQHWVWGPPMVRVWQKCNFVFFRGATLLKALR